MPKLKPSEYQVKNRELVILINGALTRHGLRKTDLQTMLRLKETATNDRLKNPDKITLGQIRRIVSTLKIPSDEVCKWIL